MTRETQNGRVPWYRAAGEVARGSILSFYEHWALALFSVAAAFAIWFVVQDVENPRVSAPYPPLGVPASIEVQAVNAQDAGLRDTHLVSVDVEGRENDLESLTNDDFVATVDVKNVPLNTPVELPVRVRSQKDGVRVLSVQPATITVTLEPIVEQTFSVTLNTSGQLTAGLEAKPVVEPVQVKVRGLAEELQTVTSVDLDVNLSGLREGESTFEGELTARSASGSSVEVAAISPARARVTYTVAQTFVQRSLPVEPVLTGQVASGYRIASITVEPPTLSATGPRNLLDGRTKVLTEAIPIGGATSEVRLVRNVEAIDNVSFERRTVTVRIEIKQIECGAGNPACPATVVFVAPGFQNPPAGQFVQGAYQVGVRLAGPLNVLQAVDPRIVVATVNLGAPTAPGLYPVTVNLPASLTNAGVRAEAVDPITVTLGPTP